MSTVSSVPTHGNYHGYYSKRPFRNDERLLSLPSGLFKGARVLDIGCNEGWVTCEIAQSYGAHLVVGVDIDESLITNAWRRRRAVWSCQAPTYPRTSNEEDDLTSGDSKPRKRRKLQDEGSSQVNDTQPIRHYFPASCEHEFGSLPIPPSSNRGKNVFPHNVSFRTADWMRTDIPEDSEGYNVVIAFSISKWIHLNEGDEGLKLFFRRVYAVLKPGGSFVLEPQPWESYAKAKRMNQKLKENGKNLVIRPSDFEAILREIGFGHPQHFGTVGEGGFSRPIDLYIKV
ncbi:putative RNA methyltransferase C2A9.10 [Psilocybe cubensis]|uniref:RNA methyltransferase n=2 Tax=Psilocybe cubensis TaxID=181762 RepID=A0A8H7Y4Q3_PSICU|nr:putative RNA methyltransferase C2A9.10 [Psilocybe cubensis]KAH9483708.1 putative RNA methyltransferase C2A9.10 [Psilocybe cubensis]